MSQPRKILLSQNIKEEILNRKLLENSSRFQEKFMHKVNWFYSLGFKCNYAKCRNKNVRFGSTDWSLYRVGVWKEGLEFLDQRNKKL